MFTDFPSYENISHMDSFICSGTAGEYSFTNCHWRDSVSDDNGAAISLTGVGSSLTVEKCSFIDCKAKGDCGGAISIHTINKASIIESFFLHCNVADSTNYSHGGGCVYLEDVRKNLFIKLSCFIDSSAPHDGGGAVVYDCSCTEGDETTFQSCRFINCRGTNSDGGGIMADKNNYNIGISNTLFSLCFNYVGGGFNMTLSASFSSPFVLFSFFNQNKATFGNDVAFENHFAENNLYWLPYGNIHVVYFTRNIN